MRLIPYLPLAFLLASCDPAVGEEYVEVATGATVRVVSAGDCDDVRGELPAVAERERRLAFERTGAVGAADTSWVPVLFIEDEAEREPDGPPSSCVAFVVTSTLDDSGNVVVAMPEEVILCSRGAFRERFERES